MHSYTDNLFTIVNNNTIISDKSKYKKARDNILKRYSQQSQENKITKKQVINYVNKLYPSIIMKLINMKDISDNIDDVTHDIPCMDINYII